jgi:hypothetical protein
MANELKFLIVLIRIIISIIIVIIYLIFYLFEKHSAYTNSLIKYVTL